MFSFELRALSSEPTNRQNSRPRALTFPSIYCLLVAHSLTLRARSLFLRPYFQLQVLRFLRLVRMLVAPIDVQL